MHGIQAVPASIYIALMFTVPKSPRWLLSKFRNEEVRKVLAIVPAFTNIETLVLEIQQSGDKSHDMER